MATEVEKIDFISKFENLVDGLFVMSETDAPLKPFVWKKVAMIDDSLLRKKAKKDGESMIETLSIEDFFRNMVTPQDWHSEQEKTDVLKFQLVLENISSTLSEPKVYKIGDAKKEVFLVGKTKEGEYAGLKTYVVET